MIVGHGRGWRADNCQAQQSRRGSSSCYWHCCKKSQRSVPGAIWDAPQRILGTGKKGAPASSHCIYMALHQFNLLFRLPTGLVGLQIWGAEEGWGLCLRPGWRLVVRLPDVSLPSAQVGRHTWSAFTPTSGRGQKNLGKKQFHLQGTPSAEIIRGLSQLPASLHCPGKAGGSQVSGTPVSR